MHRTSLGITEIISGLILYWDNLGPMYETQNLFTQLSRALYALKRAQGVFKCNWNTFQLFLKNPLMLFPIYETCTLKKRNTFLYLFRNLYGYQSYAEWLEAIKIYFARLKSKIWFPYGKFRRKDRLRNKCFVINSVMKYLTPPFTQFWPIRIFIFGKS